MFNFNLEDIFDEYFNQKDINYENYKTMKINSKFAKIYIKWYNIIYKGIQTKKICVKRVVYYK